MDIVDILAGPFTIFGNAINSVGQRVSKALVVCFVSPDGNQQSKNIVDGLTEIASSINRLADAIEKTNGN